MQQKILIELLTANSHKAIPLIYDKYSGALYGIILRIVKQEEVAQELLQDTFVKIWQKRSYFDNSKGRLFTWMAQIARNLSINYLNSKSCKNKSKVHPIASNVHAFQSHYSIKVDTVDVGDMIKKLDDKYRQIVDLAYFQGYTQKEISERLNMPLGSVKSGVKIALRELKKIYDGSSHISQVGMIIYIVLMMI